MRKYALPALIAAVGLAFAAACLLVWLTRGRGPGLGAKLRLGGLLLAMTGVVATGYAQQDHELCYKTVPRTDIQLSGPREGSRLVVDVVANPVLRGTLRYRFDNTIFSWSLSNEQAGAAVRRGEVVAEDGAFDQPTERVRLILPRDLAPGRYTLRLYAVPVTGQAAAREVMNTVFLQITNRD